MTVVGDALVDVHVRPATALRPDADVPAEIRLEPGGQGANLAVRLARRGLSVRLRCTFADDAAGRWLGPSLEAEGVELDVALADATGSVVVIIAPDGKRTMLSHRIPLVPLLGADADPTSWRALSGYVLAEPGAATALGPTAAASHTAVAGCALPDDARDGWLRAVAAAGADLLVLNADEATALVPGLSAHECAAALAERLEAVVVVTDRRGATVAGGAGLLRRDVAEAADGADSTGAGDAFTAGLLSVLVDHPWPPSAEVLERALDVAGRLAAAVARVPGAQGRVDGEPERGGSA